MLFSSLLAALILSGTEPGPVTVELLPTKPGELAIMPRVEIKITNVGQSVVYAGTPLAAILDGRTKPMAGMPGLRDLADAVILARGADGYQAAISAVSVAMDPKGERFLLASTRNGQAIPPQVIIPGDPKQARWVRDVIAVRLVRLHNVVKPDP